MKNDKQDNIKCTCGKILARAENNKIYVWCKTCHKEIEICAEPTEPKNANNFLMKRFTKVD